MEMNKIKEQLTSRFEMKDLGEAKFILGIQINRDRPRRILNITQHEYLKKVIHQHGMSDIKKQT